MKKKPAPTFKEMAEQMQKYMDAVMMTSGGMYIVGREPNYLSILRNWEVSEPNGKILERVIKFAK